MTAVNHWFVTVSFAAIGGLALVYPSCFTRIRPYFKQIRARGWAYDRVIAVAVRREQLENVPRAYGPGNLVRLAAMLASVCVMEAFMIVSLRNMFGGPAAEELERWQLLESA